MCASRLTGEQTQCCTRCLAVKKQERQKAQAMAQANIVTFTASRELCHGWYVGPGSKLLVPWTCPEPGCNTVLTGQSL